MRVIALAFTFLIGFSSCRSIQGEFYESFGEGWGGAQYNFHQNGTFEYKSQYDVGGEYGEGTYQIRFGFIRFTCRNAHPKTYTQANCYEGQRDSTDSTRSFYMSFCDENRDPFPFGVVQYVYSCDSLTRGSQTDIDGALLITVPDSCDTIFIKYRTIGYATFEKTIDVAKRDTLKVMLYIDPNWGLSPVDSGRVSWYRCRVNSRDTVILTERKIEEVEVSDYNTKRVKKKVVRKLVRK